MANLRFFGSTVDAIAPQEQNALARYANQNLTIGLNNQAAAERARAASINAWARAQENEQNQAQLGYANKVNLLEFGENLRRNRATEDLTAGNTAARLQQFKAQTDADEQGRFADVQTAILQGGLKSLDEAWAYIPKTPQNVVRVTKLLETANKELVKGQLEQLNKATASAKADRLAAALKLNSNLSAEQKKEVMRLSPEELQLLPRMVGQLAPGIRWNAATEEWTTEPEAQPSSNPLQEYRPGSMNPVAALAVSAPRTATRSAPAIAFGPMGAGGVPRRSTSAPPVLRAPVTATNAPQRKYIWTPQGLVPK